MQLRTLSGDVTKVTSGGETTTRRLMEILARDTSVSYAFVAPAFFLLLFLVAYPFVLSVWFSLSDARVGTAGGFVGLGNFERLFSSSIFLQTTPSLGCAPRETCWHAAQLCSASTRVFDFPAQTTPAGRSDV